MWSHKVLLTTFAVVLLFSFVENSPLSHALNSHYGRPLKDIIMQLGCEHKKCPAYARPVCAVDSAGVTRNFLNRCFMDYVYCTERKVYAYVKDGEC